MGQQSSVASAKPLRLVKPLEAGRLLGVTAARVRQLADSGQLPEHKTPDGFRFYLLEDVEQLVAERAREREANRAEVPR